ncbi:unnamed protein product [Peronospora destructor]|uniref:Acyltransferase 3 domain-containing protein n=1 Tax=Peronospora destructor TaxID=86335 RepID=A0AAV0TF82_9STRA|nr:unnamed protein product [Peronospora destructor]
MLQDTRNDNTNECHEEDAMSSRETDELQAIELSDEGTSTSSSDSNGHILTGQFVNNSNAFNEKVSATTSLPPPAKKRFFRVYPLFAATAIVLYFMSPENQGRYYYVNHGTFDLFKTLTFVSGQRHHVLWTLPLEIAYYFIIPGFVLVAIGMGRIWWVGAFPLMGWIVHEGWTLVRESHTPLSPHLHTFMLGSLAAVVYEKLDMLITTKGFKFGWWHTLLLRAVEGLIIALLLSVCFRGLLFDWLIKNPAPPAKGFPFASVFMASIIVIEIIHPSCVSTMLECSVFRYWGKISFSIYLLTCLSLSILR